MFDDKSIIQLLIAMGGGVVTALASHFNLRGRVNNLKSDADRAEDERKEFRGYMMDMKEDIAFIRGKYERDQG